MDADELSAKLAPEAASTLMRAGSFLSAYELIKSEIVDKVHDFFWCGFQGGVHQYDERRYGDSVLALNPRSRYLASCAWLVDMRALTDRQVDTLEEIRKHRHEIAHELPKLLVDPEFEVRSDLLLAAVECVRCLGVFWGSIEAGINSDFDDVEVDYEGIKSGPYILMEYLVSIAGLGEELNIPSTAQEKDSAV
ncbi:hypothetical protein PGH47_17940 [Streptomyces sp. HUAS 31]|uniref:hypothetical protein n=1 Tax=Streptomyces sp. HUAS 31 TaxID=3020055 RepID=UPI0023055C85|nr:hypothetical protein [Streptomyces sp. HUAS 31]WCD97452.1 hypothetical protein PGH47_17940 [Streptomyces sp. HUAS 31]